MNQPTATPSAPGDPQHAAATRRMNPVAAHPITSTAIFVLVTAAILRHADRPDLRPYHAEDRRLPLLLLVPADLHAGRGARALDRHACCSAGCGGQTTRQRARRTRTVGAMSNVNTVVFTIVVVLFVIVTVVGFAAARWRRAERHAAPERVGAGGPGLRHVHHAGSCSAATSTPPTRSSPCPRWCSAPARSASSRSPTRSWCTRSRSSSCPGCGRSAGCTTTSRPPTSSGAGTAPAAWRWPWPSPASWR